MNTIDPDSFEIIIQKVIRSFQIEKLYLIEQLQQSKRDITNIINKYETQYDKLTEEYYNIQDEFYKFFYC